jgi:hypothetical protein
MWKLTLGYIIYIIWTYFTQQNTSSIKTMDFDGLMHSKPPFKVGYHGFWLWSFHQQLKQYKHLVPMFPNWTLIDL